MCCKGLDTVIGNLTPSYITAVVTSIVAFLVTVLVCVGAKYGLWRDPAVGDQQSSETVGIDEADSSTRTKELDITELQETESARDFSDDICNRQIRRRAKSITIQHAEKIIQAGMTEEQKLQEKMIQQQQLAQIFQLLQKQPEKFGSTTLEDVQQQLKLYRS